MQEIMEKLFSAQMQVIHGEETSSHHIKQTERKSRDEDDKDWGLIFDTLQKSKMKSEITSHIITCMWRTVKQTISLQY